MRSKQFRHFRSGLAVLFGAVSLAKLTASHDLYTGLWSFAVCLALVLGLLPHEFLEHKVFPATTKPEKHNLL